MEWILQIPILLFSIIIHEVSHGWTAYRRGDDTAYLSGRLTFNPIPHIDPVGTILLPVMCFMGGLPVFGWAKPVPVNPYRMNDSRRDMAMVAVSGPVSNLILAVISAFIFKIIVLSAHTLGPDMTFTLITVCRFAVMINLALAVFNLVPVFPLDGSQILMGLLPRKWLETYEKHIPYGTIILLVLMFTGIIRYIIIPPLSIILIFLSKMGLAVW